MTSTAAGRGGMPAGPPWHGRRAAELAAAVLVARVGTPGRLGLDAARTAAFAAWMVEHLVLAAHERAGRRPLRMADFGSNRPFLVRAAAALGFLALALALSPVRSRPHPAPLDPAAWTAALGVGLLFPANDGQTDLFSVGTAPACTSERRAGRRPARPP